MPLTVTAADGTRYRYDLRFAPAAALPWTLLVNGQVLARSDALGPLRRLAADHAATVLGLPPEQI